MSDFNVVDKRKLGKPEKVVFEPKLELEVSLPAVSPVKEAKQYEIEVYPQTLARCHFEWLKAEQDAIIKSYAVKSQENEL